MQNWVIMKRFGVAIFLCILCGGLSISLVSGVTAESTNDSVTMLIPNVWAMPGDTINLPIVVLEEVRDYAVFSVSLDFTFDPDFFTLVGDSVMTEGTISHVWKWLFVYNKIDFNTLRMVWAAVDSLKGNGPFVFISTRIDPTASLGETRDLSLEACSINEGYPACRAMSGILTIGGPPQIEISETTHDFGTVPIGQIDDWNLRISNVGDNTLDIYHLFSDISQFELSSPMLPHSVSASESMNAIITFKPSTDDTTKGNLKLFSNDLDNLVIDIHVKGNGKPTRVQLLSFTAYREGCDVILMWSTSLETDLLGYYLYRSCDPENSFEKVNSEIIIGHSSYTFCDRVPSKTNLYYYRLNSVDQSGHEETIGFTVIKGIQSYPMDFYLSQNFPNPFNPITSITFGITEEENISLIVYNTLGQAIKTLYVGIAEPGYYSVSWNGTDDIGKTQPSGIYFYQLVSPQCSISKQMLLLR